jgi:hypothetical protein
MATVRTRGSGGTAQDPYVTGAATTRRTSGQTQQVNAPPMVAPPSAFTMPPTTYNSGPAPYTTRSGNTGVSGHGFPNGTTPPPFTQTPYTWSGAPTQTPGTFYQPGNAPSMPTSMDPEQIAALFRSFGFPGGVPPAGGNTSVSQYGGGNTSFDLGAFQRAAGTAAQGQSGSLDDFVNNIFPSLQGQFPGIERFGSKGDKIRLPNGQVIDAVLGAGAGGRGYQWEPETGGGLFGDPLLNQFTDLGRYGIEQLLAPQGIHPAYTDAQRGMIATNFTEPLEAQRSARKQQALERAAARGMAPSSGLLELNTRDIDRSFDAQRAEGERGLALNEIAANEARGQESVGIGQALASLSGKNLPIQLSAANQMAGIGGSLQNEGTNRLLQALGISGQLAQLPGQQMMQSITALNALNPQQTQDQNGQLMNLLMSLAGMGEGAHNQNQQQNAAFWQSLFQMLPGVIGAFR